jgi:hypothetical protein
LLLALTVLSAALTSAHTTPAAAQQPISVRYSCSGTLEVVRADDIKPGMMDKFLAAVAAQKEWSSKNGFPVQIKVLNVLTQNPATKAWTVSKTKLVTTHSISTDAIEPPHDAGYAAFVAMYNDSSTITATYTTCVAQ